MDNPGGCEYGKTRIVVVCYNTDGSLNLDFTGDGMTIFNFDACNDESYTLLVQPDDNIIIGGGSGNSSILESFDYIFIRISPEGTRDPLFGTNGLLESDMYETYEFYSYPKALCFQPSGKAIMAGFTNDWDIGHTFFSTMRIVTGVDPDELEQMNWNNQSEIDSTTTIWYYGNELNINNTSHEPMEMSLFAITGTLLYAFQAEEGYSQFSLKDLPKGMYFVVYHEGNNVITHEFVVSYAGY
jgi:hypothetical protein